MDYTIEIYRKRTKFVNISHCSEITNNLRTFHNVEIIFLQLFSCMLLSFETKLIIEKPSVLPCQTNFL